MATGTTDSLDSEFQKATQNLNHGGSGAGFEPLRSNELMSLNFIVFYSLLGAKFHSSFSYKVFPPERTV